MRVLLTRPLDDSRLLKSRLEEAGCAVTLAPLMDVRPVALSESGRGQLKAAIDGAGSGLVFTSANGVRALATLMPDAFGLPCFCVGRQTADAARRAGAHTVFHAEGDLASLLRVIEAKGSSRNLLHLRGHHQAGNLVGALRQKHYNAVAICAYNAVELEPPASLSDDLTCIGAVMLYSPRSSRLLEKKLIAAGLQCHAGHIFVYGLSRAVVDVLTLPWLGTWHPETVDSRLLEQRVIEDCAS